MLRRSAFPFVCWLLLGVGCGGSTEPVRAQRHPTGKSHAKGAVAAAGGLGPLPAHRFAEVSDVVGPYVGRDGELSLAAWAEATGTGRSLFATPIDERGVPGVPVRVGNLAPELDLVLVKGFGAASAKTQGAPRFALITTRRTEQKTQILVTALSATGTPAWGPSSITERSARVLWVGFVVAGETPLLLWAEQPSTAKPGEPAVLLTLPLEPDSKQAPLALAGKACVWQVAAVGGQAALASVKANGNSCTTGSVVLDFLNSSGRSDKSIELGSHASLDLDLVGAPGAFVAAWSDREQLEPRVVSAVVEPSGAVRSPAAPAVAALGEQVVVALTAGASPSAPAFLVWENLAERPEGARFFEISALDAKGRSNGVRSRLLYGRVDGSAPELTSFGSGIAALTLAPACGPDDDCETSLPVPTFVALDASLRVLTSEPLVLDALGGRAADLGWGLTCAKLGCFALAAPSRSPAALFSVPLPVRASRYRAAAEDAVVAAKPRVVSSDLLARADAPLAHIAVAELGNRTLVGYVTDFDPTTPWQKLSKPAEDGRLEPLRARVAVRAFASDGKRAPLSDEQAISLRAHSLGGLSLPSDLAGPSSSKESMAIWTGLDKGEPQVFLTLLAADGKRSQQRMLTRKTGEASDVASMAVDGGYLIAWVDERSHDAEVYATRVSRTLEKAAPEQRLTSADGAAAELQLVRVAGKPYAIWADARAAEQPGWADIYGAFLRPSDAARDGGEHRLSQTRPNSFSPRVSELGGTTVVAWLEEADGASPASVRLAKLSDAGDIADGVHSVPIAAGAARGLGLGCQGTTCRVAVSVEAEGRAELYGFEWKPGAAEPRVQRLTGLGAPGAAAVAPVIRGDLVYVADLRDGHGLVRRLGVEW